MREIKFRVRDVLQNRWLDTDSIKRLHYNYTYDDKKLIFQQFTGLKSKNNKEIYQGDIIRFLYTVGDFAWQEMDDKEALCAKKMNSKKFIGVITPNILTSINLDIIVGNPKSTHMMFPLYYAKNSEILGNTFENPKLRV